MAKAGSRMRRAIVWVTTLLLLAALPGAAKRTNPPKVPPVVKGGIRYVAPNTDGRVGFVEARDAKTGKRVWTAVLFRNRINRALEEDVQWVYIKTLGITGHTLLATDERGRRYTLDLTRRAPHTPPARLYEPFIGVPFLLPGEKLGIGFTVIGEPISAFEKLYVQNARGLTQVKGPNGLVGHVRIDTPDKALRYVRLFTSPTTVCAFNLPVWLEVVPARVVTLDFLYGNKRTQDFVRNMLQSPDPERDYGVVKDSEWRTYGLSLPRVTQEGRSFVVTRALVQIEEESVWGTGIVQQVAETVTRDGHVGRKALSTRKVPGLLVRLLPEE